MLLGSGGKAHAVPILGGSDFGPSSTQLTFAIFGFGTDTVDFTSVGLSDTELVRQVKVGKLVADSRVVTSVPLTTILLGTVLLVLAGAEVRLRSKRKQLTKAK